ncbi:MAG: hypothetical protein ABUL66_00405 [Verrucomicrobiota bacterium]
MTTKTIVVLANSVKNSGRCLAGKEVVWAGGGWQAGGWIRPVASPDGGEVGVPLMRQALGREPALLDILELPLVAAAPQPGQPENWLLARDRAWQACDYFNFDDLPQLLDRPADLWGTNQRCVEAGFPQRMARPASLYLVQPESIALRVWTEEAVNDEGRSYERHRRRATLRHQGTFYEFDITDPQLQARYYPQLPAINDPALTISLRAPKKTAVCVSLTPAWQGRHYKLAAAFIEPPLETKI